MSRLEQRAEQNATSPTSDWAEFLARPVPRINDGQVIPLSAMRPLRHAILIETAIKSLSRMPVKKHRSNHRRAIGQNLGGS